jgi:predicted nucleic acid-binding protein
MRRIPCCCIGQGITLRSNSGKKFVPEWEEEAWQMFKRYPDKAFSFTDCTSFVVMRHRGMWEAFTNDHNFAQVGYQRLLT